MVWDEREVQTDAGKYWMRLEWANEFAITVTDAHGKVIVDRQPENYQEAIDFFDHPTVKLGLA